MKRSTLTTFLFFSIMALSNAQAAGEIEKARTVLSNMVGKFTWEMWKPSEGKKVREGTSEVTLEVEKSVLLLKESVAGTTIEMLGMLGYNERENRFFSISTSNIDEGPYIMYGKMAYGSNSIEFIVDEVTKHVLNTNDRDGHYWETFALVDNEWKKQDKLIIFKRVYAN